MSSTVEKHAFQAEVKQLLDIVIHSLYTDKEIFIRELVSNASDALEKLRHTMLTEKEIFEGDRELAINVTTDKEAKTITIYDSGIGMTDAELRQNLGTIAHSGSKAFLEALKQEGNKNENLIGQFGVGFYSAFMVAKQVDVYSRSYKTDAQGYHWTSEGTGEYSIEAEEGLTRGTKIVVHLKEEHEEFAKADKVKSILEHYSNYVPFALNLDEEKVNTVDAIWLRSKSEVKEEEYKEFYKFQAKAFDEPLSWVHFSADAPLDINAVLYVPTSNMEQFGMMRMEPAVSLYCKKVLIDANPKEFLPEWMRFAKGVVDSADLPLNISRETMQDSALINKLGRVITKRMIKHIKDLSNKDQDKFKTFWNTFAMFIKEGVANDFDNREGLCELLRFHSTMTQEEEMVSLEDYVSRMKDDQKEIYYLIGKNKEALETSPYLEAFKKKGYEVLYLYDSVDDYVMQQLRTYKEKNLVAADSANVDLDISEGDDSLSDDEKTSFAEWLKATVGEERINEVSWGKRLTDSPILALNADPHGSIHMRQMMKAMNQDAGPSMTASLELNPKHALIQSLIAAQQASKPEAELLAKQLVDNALLAGGYLEDTRDLVSRNYELLAKLAEGAK